MYETTISIRVLILHSLHLQGSKYFNSYYNVRKQFCYREKMAQAYDFALDKIGLDIHAFPIWNDYVTFLKAVDAVGSYAENQKISAVRKVDRLVYLMFFYLFMVTSGYCTL